MAVPPVPTDPTGSNPYSPASSRWQTSGGCDASAVSGVVQDWYLHTQGFNGMYQRNQKWRDCDSRSTQTPTVEYNYIDAHTNVWTNDQIITNTTFSACLQVTQQITYSASGSCSSPGGSTGASGWGTMGTFTTCGEGTILRPARKDAANNYLDPSGFCKESFNFELGAAPDAFNCSSGWDTEANVKTDLGRLANECNNYCPTFNATLVNIS